VLCASCQKSNDKSLDEQKLNEETTEKGIKYFRKLKINDNNTFNLQDEFKNPDEEWYNHFVKAEYNNDKLIKVSEKTKWGTVVEYTVNADWATINFYIKR